MNPQDQIFTWSTSIPPAYIFYNPKWQVLSRRELDGDKAMVELVDTETGIVKARPFNGKYPRN